MLADALRLLKTDPPPDWQEAYVAAAQQLMQCSDSRNLPLTLAPLVRWRVSPGEAWLQQYLAACEGLLPSMQAQVRQTRGALKGLVATNSRAPVLPSVICSFMHVACAFSWGLLEGWGLRLDCCCDVPGGDDCKPDCCVIQATLSSSIKHLCLSPALRPHPPFFILVMSAYRGLLSWVRAW